MPNKNNSAQLSHADNSATSTAHESGFNFRFPTFTEDVFIKHPSACYLNDAEKAVYAYEFLRDCVFPSYGSVSEKFDIVDKLKSDLKTIGDLYKSAFLEINSWTDKPHYNSVLWDMLELSITNELADCNNGFRRDAMTLYKMLEKISCFIWDLNPFFKRNLNQKH